MICNAKIGEQAWREKCKEKKKNKSYTRENVNDYEWNWLEPYTWNLFDCPLTEMWNRHCFLTEDLWQEWYHSGLFCIFV